MNYNSILIRICLYTFGFLFTISANAQVGQIIWEENFNTLDTDVWNITTGNGCPDLCGWGNSELEYYASDNVSIEEITDEPGNYGLVLEAKSESIDGFSFSSGKVSSEQNLAIKYGMIEVRMKVPDIEIGLWPAFWLLGTNQSTVGWPKCGEIDMMEMGQSAQFRSDKGVSDYSENDVVGSNLIFYSDDACDDDNLTCAASISYDNYYCTPYAADTPLNDRFVIYRLYWDDEEIRFTVEDDEIIHNMYTGAFPIGDDAQEFKKPFYMIINLAVGGNFTDASAVGDVTAPLPGKMIIDYIRIRKWNGKGELTLPGELIVNAGSDITVEENDTVNLDGSSSYGNIISYEWTIADSVISTDISHDIVLPVGVHNITLTAFDSDGNTASDEITVQVGSESIGEIIWEENFDSFNSEIWNSITGDGCPDLCGWGNSELEYYHPDNVSIEGITGEDGNNALVLEAKSESISTSSFSSGKITTENKLAIKYGVVEVRMKVPEIEIGLWPAAWLLGVNHNTVGWPECGEIDMMEMGHSDEEISRQGFAGVSQNNYVGANLLWYESGSCSDDNQTCAASIAYDTYYDSPYIASTPLNERYVIYRTYWDENEIRFTVEDNGVEYDLYASSFPISDATEAFRQPYYFILNLAVGGSFTGISDVNDVTAPLPAKMYVDYVRVRKWKGKGEVAFVDGNSIANAGVDQVLVDTDKDGSEAVSLDAKNSYGKIVSYFWSEGGAQIASGENPTVDLSSGNHFITLTATDTNGYVSTDDVSIEIREIIWEDNFSAFDSDIWNIETGDGCPDLCGWGNSELEYYQSENVYTEEVSSEANNHALVLEAKSELVSSSSFTSGKVTTHNNMNIRYGLVEVRMQVPDLETGLWPAAWMLGANQDSVGWPACGEIDMMEMGQSAQFRSDKGVSDYSENDVVGANLIFYSDDACADDNLTCAASISYDNYYCTPYSASTPLNDRFVIYRTYWDDEEIRFTVEDDGNEYDLYTGPFPIGDDAQEFHKPFYFILNLAVGGNFTDASAVGDVTAPLPAKMLVDYVRIMKWNGKGEVAFASGLIANAGTDVIVVDSDGDKSEDVVLDGTGSYDQDGTIVSYSWTENGSEIATEASPIVSLSRDSHKIALTVSDNDGNSESDTVIVVVSGGGLAPTAVAGNDTILYDDNGDDMVSFMLDGSDSFDSNDTIKIYQWTENDSEIATGETAAVELSTGIHTIALTVSNSDSLTDSDDIIITIIDPDNTAPIANAGTNQSLEDDDDDDLVALTLDGSGSSDSDGTIESYSWVFEDVEIANGVSPSVELSTGIYELILQVTDNDGASAYDTVRATLIDPDNNAPIANAGVDTLLIDAALDGLFSYTLDAMNSTDSDGYIESYLWMENGSTIATGESATVEFSLGVHTLILVATDDDGGFDTDTVNITINQLPVAHAGEDILVTDNDANDAETVTLSASESSDPDGSIVTYSWELNSSPIGTGISMSYAFGIGTNVVSLYVTDNYGSIAMDEVLVVVANYNNTAPIADAGEDMSILEDDGDGLLEIQLDASGSSDSDGSIYSYSWLEDDIEIAIGINPDVIFEVGTHTVTLSVTDNEGATSTDEVVIIVLNRLNLALNKTTVSSSEENAGTASSLAVDGDESSRWSSTFIDPQWIYVDLGMSYTLNQIVLKWEAAYADGYEVQVSEDASNWTTVYTEASGDGGTDEHTITSQGRYVRIYGTSRATVYGYSLYELEVYGSSNVIVDGLSTLSDLRIDAVSVDGFSSDILSYNYFIEAESTVIPVVTATASDSDATIAYIPATTIPGESELIVTSEFGTSTTSYTVYFTYTTSISTTAKLNLNAYSFKEKLYVKSDESLLNGTVELYNLLGIKILNETILNTTEVYEPSTSGILILRILDKNKNAVLHKQLYIE